MDGFVFKHPAKPCVERRSIPGHEIACACGTKWIATPAGPAGFARGNECPDCGNPPAPGRVGPLQTFDVDVELEFGNGKASAERKVTVVR